MKRAAIIIILIVVLLLLILWRCAPLSVPEPGLPTPTATAVSTTTPETYPTGEAPTITPTAVPATATPTATAVPPTTTPTSAPTVTAVPTETATAVPSPTMTPLPETYTVQRDDWLIKIAIRLYGGQYGWQWRCLWQRNRGVVGDDPNLIYAGQVLGGVRGCAGVRP